MNSYCVYMHISPSNKKYIGITRRNPNRRWRNGRGYQNNQYFINAINKYGWDNFQHIIIARGLTEEEAKWLEIELIKINDSANPNKGYNISLGGEGTYGYHHTEESKNKSSKSNIGKNQPNARPVVCITTKRIFEGVRVASRYYGIDHSTILKCCKGKIKSAGKYNNQRMIWRYLNYKHNKRYRVKKGA